MRNAVLVVALLAGCPAKPALPPKPPAATASPALRLRIAQLEATRGDGLGELIELANNGEHAAQLLALRGLGRVGGSKALATLTAAARDAELDRAEAAASAIGIATSLDEDTANTPAITAALLEAHARHPGSTAIVEAVGRATASEAVLVAGLRGTPAIAEASALALGRFGRRKVGWSAAARAAVLVATKHGDPRVRLAAAYALAREHLVEPAPGYLGESGTTLELLLKDPGAQLRAQAAQALARRKSVGAHGEALARVLDDPDWRVAVEAVRALAGDGSTDAWRVRVAQSAGRWVQRDAEGAHVVLEALRALAPHTAHAELRALIGQLARAAEAPAVPALTRAWIGCLAAAASLRGEASTATLDRVLTCKLPDHLRLPIVGELIAAKVGSLEARRAALAPLLAHRDPRVRVAGMTALAALWSEGDAADHEAVVAMVIAALGAKEGLVAGTAVETAETLYEALDKASEPALRERLDAALLARAQAEQDPELATSLFALIGKRKLAAGAPACRHGVGGGPVLAKAAVECLKALGETLGDAPLPVASAKPPPVDVAAVIGKQVRWTLITTRGEIAIELAPEVAPWAVATIVALTRKHYYDGLELHRVVGNFVAQGGDPTQSGWGGPGFTLPAEPSAGAGYVEGGVGMADAGRDSAGSQWFVMHGPAPHLDGRYTWVGHVIRGQKAANSLQIGDRVETATVIVSDRP